MRKDEEQAQREEEERQERADAAVSKRKAIEGT